MDCDNKSLDFNSDKNSITHDYIEQWNVNLKTAPNKVILPV
jgi:hypothetical protein